MDIIAWRGASWVHLENTLLAAIQAEKDGYDAMEIDTRLTSDGKLIAFHSPTYGSWEYPTHVDLVPWEICSKFRKCHRKLWYRIPLVKDILSSTTMPVILHVKREVDIEMYYKALNTLSRSVDIHSNSEDRLDHLKNHPSVNRVFKSVYTPQSEVLQWVDGYMLGHHAFGDSSALVEEWLEKIKDKVKYVFAGNTQNWINEVKQYKVDGLLTGRIDRYED